MVLLTHKIELKLNQQQMNIINNMSDEARQLYNYYLAEKIDYYKENNKTISYFTQQKTLKNYKTEYIMFDSKKETLRLLDFNFKSFYKLLKSTSQVPHIPKFRGYKYFFTLSFVQDFIIKNKQIIISLPNRERLNIDILYDNPINGSECLRNKTKKSDIKQLKIYKKDGKYFASIIYEKIVKSKKNNKYISIDLGKKNLVTIYDQNNNKGIIYNSKNLEKNLKYFDKRIDELVSKKDIKQINSNNNKKIQNKLTKIRNKKKQQQKLTLHKLAKDIANMNSNVVLGDLTNLKKNIISKYKGLNRQMQNNWNLTTFVNLLTYKVELKGNKLIKVNEAWTSKTCSKCGSIMKHQTLSNRQYKCDCGLDIDRDVNGAINILDKYLGDYNTPIDFENISESKRYEWCHSRHMNKN